MEQRLEHLQQHISHFLKQRLPRRDENGSVRNATRRWWQQHPLYEKLQPSVPEAPEPRCLSVVLGGGGGKGGAHLGVLQVLEELDVQIDMIVGTSIGGAVGVLYAAGLSLNEISQVFQESTVRRIAVADPTRTGFIGSRKREAVLQKLLGERTFADLSIPCAVVAVDLVSGQDMFINEGPLVPALLATTALPGVFPPVARDQALLADGGILNNVPTDVARQLGANRIIAVQLVATNTQFAQTLEVPDNPVARLALAPRQFAIANRALSLLISHATETRLAQNPPDVLIRPEVDEIPTLNMNRPDEGRKAGELAAREAMDLLLELRTWQTMAMEPAPPKPPRRQAFGLSFLRKQTSSTSIDGQLEQQA
ncbi:MAG: patatin [Chloroflexi bacterium AL-W]|nr:patatin [Chloroflexi bacterium AL-N1]NOK65244.1 patatin [Chloroflexi bacterium AL-N10]NOK72491.1 patatin [Chloroflexi bacterium AL-N5]NOK79423.1 patatin [Chloroflexi bacterium AL-W]NOK87339.1 patatin [Chloroflexi bacterium AL-N15]